MKNDEFKITFTDSALNAKIHLAYNGKIKDVLEALELYAKFIPKYLKEIKHLATSYNPNKPVVWIKLTKLEDDILISEYGILESDVFNSIYKYKEQL